jgi:radical SAM protein with 4Fe4S-binding SPASM domain
MKYPLPYIIFEVTSACNLNCRYCYNIWKRPGEEPLTMNSYRKARKTLRHLFRKFQIDHVTFTGGEPLLAERIEELILYCRLKRKTVTLITNGSGGDEHRYRLLKEMGIGLFEIPLHAPVPEVHDQITRMKGSWEHSVNSIKTLKAMGAIVVPVVVVTKMNVKYLGETLRFICGHLQCNQIMINRYNIGGTGFSENLNILPSAAELQSAWAEANQLAIDLNLSLTSNVCTPACLLNPSDYPQIGFGHCSSDPSRMPVTADIDGNIRLCNHSPVVIGNIFSQTPEEIFTGDHAGQWLKTRPDFCSDCEIYDTCFGGCRAAALQAGLSMNDVDPVMTLFRS